MPPSSPSPPSSLPRSGKSSASRKANLHLSPSLNRQRPANAMKKGTKGDVRHIGQAVYGGAQTGIVANRLGDGSQLARGGSAGAGSLDQMSHGVRDSGRSHVNLCATDATFGGSGAEQLLQRREDLVASGTCDDAGEMHAAVVVVGKEEVVQRGNSGIHTGSLVNGNSMRAGAVGRDGIAASRRAADGASVVVSVEHSVIAASTDGVGDSTVALERAHYGAHLVKANGTLFMFVLCRLTRTRCSCALAHFGRCNNSPSAAYYTQQLRQ